HTISLSLTHTHTHTLPLSLSCSLSLSPFASLGTNEMVCVKEQFQQAAAGSLNTCVSVCVCVCVCVCLCVCVCERDGERRVWRESIYLGCPSHKKKKECAMRGCALHSD